MAATQIPLLPPFFSGKGCEVFSMQHGVDADVSCFMPDAAVHHCLLEMTSLPSGPSCEFQIP